MAVESSWIRWTANAVLSACLVLVVLAICYVVMWLRKKLMLLQPLKENCPGPKPVFLFGNALQLKNDSAEFYDQCIQWSNENWSKGFFCVWHTSFRVVVTIFKPELVEIFLGSNRQINKSFEYGMLRPWLGTVPEKSGGSGAD
ncbi:cytochrome P450 4V2 [Exaiptasia diaphana]|uniref:Cytochrome P450 n=1 Tax=Exaiptasia diaphana TaxID=2652724 RepID=A0A913WZ53_EXADI|nr:cytochrome P450 4V2 [Exaiptasia diaphana]